MITNLDPRSQLFMSEIERAQQRVAEAQQQISSGKRVSVASDDPDVVSSLLRLRAALERNTQVQTNLATAQSAANVADNTLTNALKVLDRALTLAAQAATGTQTAAGRLTFVDEVEALEEQMVTFSQTQSGGSYIFSGDQDTQPAYQLNLANPNGVDRLLTASATRLVDNPGGGSFVPSKTAQDIFDHRNLDDSLAPDNAFAALNNLRLALMNNEVPGIITAINSIKLASDRVNTCQAFYGAVQNRIQDAITLARQNEVQLRSEISQKQDADVIAASLELNTGNMQIQAALQMKGNLPRASLFDFISR
ncbi:MAG TPA: flagellin [Bryobacteraceae bacterium]|nr:flagellin [Bryobacteraceae bacterium]